MDASTHFIIIDDDVLNNRICTVTLEKIFENADIKTFIDPVEGFDHIASEFSASGSNENIILFLDIAMPAMNGWQFLDKFEALDDPLKKRVKIYILSSSDYENDMEMARANKYVVNYLVKPFTKKTLRLLTLSLGKEESRLD